jgi:hypothetical protein
MDNNGLLEIAKSINNLAAVIGSINFTLWMFLLFKNMGTSSSSIDKIAENLLKN